MSDPSYVKAPTVAIAPEKRETILGVYNLRGAKNALPFDI